MRKVGFQFRKLWAKSALIFSEFKLFRSSPAWPWLDPENRRYLLENKILANSEISPSILDSFIASYYIQRKLNMPPIKHTAPRTPSALTSPLHRLPKLSQISASSLAHLPWSFNSSPCSPRHASMTSRNSFPTASRVPLAASLFLGMGFNPSGPVRTSISLKATLGLQVRWTEVVGWSPA